MSHDRYVFVFPEPVPMDDVRASLQLAVWAAEALRGRSAVRLERPHRLHEDERRCTVDASTELGQALARVFVELLARQFGDDGFTVTRITRLVPSEMVDLESHEVR